ncbi:MAG: hypothetical protein CVU71_02865 [Deltaproteobacteria bacterium HGW-Deltaproteobacteria-6]|jgi:hypothetical protein|nr:MAG: hypothetical protein CVU71_02865 [Deltaproteobacteria bacterium HGW-Deltaproteobacteria-6]
MNNAQKTIGIIVSIVFLIMLLYPPFIVISEPHGQPGVAYDFLFGNPDHRNINTFLLLTQMFGILIIGAISFFIANRVGDRNNLTGGLWEQTGENGHPFFSGPLSSFSKIYIVPNIYKDEKSDPDYFFYLGGNEKKAMPKPNTGQQLVGKNNLSDEAYRHCKPASMEE